MCALLYIHLAIRDSECGCTNRSRHVYHKVLERKTLSGCCDRSSGMVPLNLSMAEKINFKKRQLMYQLRGPYYDGLELACILQIQHGAVSGRGYGREPS